LQRIPIKVNSSARKNCVKVESTAVVTARHLTANASSVTFTADVGIRKLKSCFCRQ